MSVLRRRIDQILQSIWPGATAGQVPVFDGVNWVTGSAGGSIAPYAHVLFVDGSYSGGAPSDGSLGAPFTTIMDAVGNLTTWTTIVVFPGAYAENVVWAPYDNTALVGLDAKSTIIMPASGSAFEWAPLAGIAIGFFTMRNLTLHATSGASAWCLRLDGNGVNTFLTDWCEISNVLCIKDDVSAPPDEAILFKQAGRIFAYDVICKGLISANNVTYTEFNGCVLYDTVLTYDDSVTWVPVMGRGKYLFCNGTRTVSDGVITTGSIYLQGQPSFEMDTTCGVVGFVTSSDYYMGPGLFNGTGLAPSIVIHGGFTFDNSFGLSGSVMLALPAQAGIPNSVVDLSGAVIPGFLSIYTAGAGSGNSMVFCRGTRFNNDYNIPSPNVVIGTYTDVDLRGAIYDCTALALDATTFPITVECSYGLFHFCGSKYVLNGQDVLPYIPNSMAGWGTVSFGNDLGFARFTFTAGGVVTLKENTANVANTPSVGYLCIFGVGYPVIQNNLGIPTDIRWDIYYAPLTAPPP